MPDAAADATPRQPTVLIADDHEDTLHMYADYFKAKGWATQLATNGEEAIARLNECVPTVVVMDVRMPRMSGPDALHILRKDSKYAHVPVIAITGVPFRELDPVQVMGFDELIRKPCLPEDLFARVLRVLDVAAEARPS
jgi:CheY-like chemotaxis protein